MGFSVAEEYCTGCGLCASEMRASLTRDKDGFAKVVITDDSIKSFCDKVCPSNGDHLLRQERSTWGTFKEVYSGYALDGDVRYKAASGGVTTAVADYLIESSEVDAVIQVGASDDPYSTEVYLSSSASEVNSHCASRYIDSSPLSRLGELVVPGKRYAVICRPCDAVALRNYVSFNGRYADSIVCILSFFCAGSPSPRASRLLAKRLGVDPSDVKSIRYRGNGWPGKATVLSKDGTVHEMEYIDSWNEILGRDIRKICKFCSDGVGEAADISSGDLWCLDNSGRPVFSEKPGMNVVFARTSFGSEILERAKSEGYIYLDSFEDSLDTLELIQPNHAMRKKTLYPKVLAMKLMHRVVPNYSLRVLKSFCSLPLRTKMRMFLGTIKRVLNHSI